MTPPATPTCPKCRWENSGLPDIFAYVIVKLMVGGLVLLSISIWNVPVAVLAVGGTSLSPVNFAENTSVLAARAPDSANNPAANMTRIETVLSLVFIEPPHDSLLPQDA
jgi:hypothetical protein